MTAPPAAWRSLSELNSADRLRHARLRAGYRTAAAAADACGWNRNTYTANENGHAPFSFTKARAYGRSYGVSAAWLYDGQPDRGAPQPVVMRAVNVARGGWLQVGPVLDLQIRPAGASLTAIFVVERSAAYGLRRGAIIQFDAAGRSGAGRPGELVVGCVEGALWLGCIPERDAPEGRTLKWHGRVHECAF